MTQAVETTQADLAFLKALVTEGPKVQRSAGELYAVAGVVYSLQCLLNGFQIAFHWQWPPLAFLLMGFGPTAVFLVWMFWLIWRNRNDRQEGIGARALTAVFTGAGIANLSMCVVFGWAAFKENNMTMWMLYPAVVAGLQGACWYVAHRLRRRLWLGAVSAGWFLTAVTLGFLVHDLARYLFVFAAALLVLMVAPGFAMMRKGEAA